MVLLLILSKYICVYWILSKCTLRDWVQVHLYPIATFTDSRIKPTARQPKKWYLIVGNFWETNCFFSATQRKSHDLRSWITAEARDHTIHDLCYKHTHQDMPLESLCFLWVQNSTSFANHAVYRGLVDNISRRRCRSIRPHTPGKLILIVYFFVCDLSCAIDWARCCHEKLSRKTSAMLRNAPSIMAEPSQCDARVLGCHSATGI